jgi:hypothetical protein
MRAVERAVPELVPVPMAERWIVCLGALRELTEGDEEARVECPFKGTVPFERCLECHLLEDSSAGWRRQPCGVALD